MFKQLCKQRSRKQDRLQTKRSSSVHLLSCTCIRRMARFHVRVRTCLTDVLASTRIKITMTSISYLRIYHVLQYEFHPPTSIHNLQMTATHRYSAPMSVYVCACKQEFDTVTIPKYYPHVPAKAACMMASIICRSPMT